MCFTFATGASKDIQSILVTRFFSGFFGSAPITNTGGVLGDLFAPAQRGRALVLYALAVVGGPTLGPLVGSALVEGGLSWRWTEFLTGIMKAAILLADVVLIDESYSPVLLKYKARKLRTATGNWALHAKHEEWDITFNELAVKYLVRPFQLLGTPICLLVALYASFVYGLLYSLLESIPIAFQDIRGWPPVLGSLPFVAVLVGIFTAAGINMGNQMYYIRRLEANAGKAVPEARLPPMMIGSLCLSGGLWIFAWTPAPVHPSAQIIACALFGCGFFAIFQAALNYLIDTFQVGRNEREGEQHPSTVADAAAVSHPLPFHFAISLSTDMGSQCSCG
jgi:MFS family permease